MVDGWSILGKVDVAYGVFTSAWLGASLLRFSMAPPIQYLPIFHWAIILVIGFGGALSVARGSRASAPGIQLPRIIDGGEQFIEVCSFGIYLQVPNPDFECVFLVLDSC